MTDLIANLRDNFGAPPDTSTIKGILRYGEMWIAGEAAVNASDLKLACETMIGVLGRAIVATEADLAKTGPTHESLADPVERSVLAYERLQEILKDVVDAAGSEDRQRATSLLEEVREASDFLRQAQEDMDCWVRLEVLRCPRCGSTESDPCSSCGLQLMYLDPSGGVKAKDASAELPPEFGRLNIVVSNIRDGKLSLPKLREALPAVEKSLNFFLASISAALQQNHSDNLSRGEDCLQSMSNGIGRLKETLVSRRVTDLQEGWIQVFRSAVELQDIRRDLLEEFGGEDGREIATRERESQIEQDSISLGRDE